MEDSAKIEFLWVETGRIKPNPWNPNRMSKELFDKLKKEIKRKGMIVPLVVRRIRKSNFQIIDGEHRFKIAKELGFKSLPCIVVEMDEKEAKLKTIQLNRLRGEDEPELLARLLKELNLEMELKELSVLLPFNQVEIEQSLKLIESRVFGGEDEEERKRLAREIEEMKRERIFSVVVSEEEKGKIEQAIYLAQMESGIDLKPGSALARICEGYLGVISKR